MDFHVICVFHDTEDFYRGAKKLSFNTIDEAMTSYKLSMGTYCRIKKITLLKKEVVLCEFTRSKDFTIWWNCECPIFSCNKCHRGPCRCQIRG